MKWRGRAALQSRTALDDNHDVVAFMKRLMMKARRGYPRGTLRSETSRAFSFEQMKRVLAKMV